MGTRLPYRDHFQPKPVTELSFDPEETVKVLSRLVQLLRNEEISSESARTEIVRAAELYEFLFQTHSNHSRLEFSTLSQWENFKLVQAFDMAVEIVSLYTWHFYDSRVIPVTLYKRERRTRRHLDHQFSTLFKELMRRFRQERDPELITEEPIYFLSQIAREKRFPKSRDHKISLISLRARFQLEISHRIETGPDSRRVLLPHEIK